MLPKPETSDVDGVVVLGAPDTMPTVVTTFKEFTVIARSSERNEYTGCEISESHLLSTLDDAVKNDLLQISPHGSVQKQQPSAMPKAHITTFEVCSECKIAV
jgi:hypothetical protein